MTITTLLQIVHREKHADKVFIYSLLGYLEIFGQRGLNIINCMRKASLRPWMAEQREFYRMREVLLSPSASSEAMSSISWVLSLLTTPLLRSDIAWYRILDAVARGAISLFSSKLTKFISVLAILSSFQYSRTSYTKEMIFQFSTMSFCAISQIKRKRKGRDDVFLLLSAHCHC